MLNIVMYFQVHQPYRLKRMKIFDAADTADFFDDELNRQVISEVSRNCYLPASSLMLRLVEQYGSMFKTAFSITGTAVEQLKRFVPEGMEMFNKLADSGCVEFIGETYFHSLSSAFDREEFVEQVEMHCTLIQKEFGCVPAVFRNTELIYDDRVSDYIGCLDNFRVILTEGVERVLGKKSAFFPRLSANGRHVLLFRHYRLSDDISFRFMERHREKRALSADDYIHRIEKALTYENNDQDLFLNLFMDYETIGEHYRSDTGIFDFFETFARRVIDHRKMRFVFPAEASGIDRNTLEKCPIPVPISWADTTRDLSAWLSGPLQKNAVQALFHLIASHAGRHGLLDALRRLSSSDHFYYMYTNGSRQDAEVHLRFSPFSLPEEAYRCYLYALSGIEEKGIFSRPV